MTSDTANTESPADADGNSPGTPQKELSYEVGYKKPPKQHQFKPGQSGNRKGRTKGTRNLKTDLNAELNEHMTVRENGKPRRISKQRALVKSMVARALSGNDRAAAKILDLYLRVNSLEDDASAAGLPLSADELDVVRTLESRLRRRVGLTETNNKENKNVGDEVDDSSNPEGET